jgi:hypothetical protein
MRGTSLLVDIIRLYILFKNSKANTGLWETIRFSDGVLRRIGLRKLGF